MSGVAVGQRGARWAGHRVDLGVAVVLALVVLGPMLLHRGYVLRGDMVLVPDQPWKGAWLGLDGRVPRFVPGDALLAGLGAVLPGDLVQKLLLLLAFVAGGYGGGRMLGAWPTTGRLAGIVLFVWNPWVHERLGIGQWPVVVGYLLLPWMVVAVERVRDGDRRGWPAVVGWLGLSAVFAPASGLIAVVVALGLLLVRARWRATAGVLACGVLVNLPWILPSSVLGSSIRAPAAEFSSFAARGESGLGVVASVLSFGGIWKGSVVPGERTSGVIVALSLVLTAVALLGLLRAARSERPRVLGLGLVGAAAVLLTLATAVPPVARGLDELAGTVPALGLLRDAHRFLGPAVLALLPGLAAATTWLQQRAVPGREAVRVVAVLLVAAPVLALPSLAWGLGGDWRPVRYPSEWYAVRDLLPPGRTVVLPWRGSYRGFPWNDRRAVLDPAPRFFPGDVLVDDRVVLRTTTLASEDPLLARVGRALAGDHPAPALRDLGVRNVLVEKDNGSEVPVLAGARTRHDGAGLTLLDLGAHVTRPPGVPSDARRRAVVVVDALVLGAWLVSCGLAARRRVRSSGPQTCNVRQNIR